MSGFGFNRRPGDEPTEVEQWIEDAGEVAYLRRSGWQDEVAKRLVHALGLLCGIPYGRSCTPVKIVGGQYEAHVAVKDNDGWRRTEESLQNARNERAAEKRRL